MAHVRNIPYPVKAIQCAVSEKLPPVAAGLRRRWSEAGQAPDCCRELSARDLGCAGGAAQRGQREPGVRLAAAVSRARRVRADGYASAPRRFPASLCLALSGRSAPGHGLSWTGVTHWQRIRALQVHGSMETILRDEASSAGNDPVGWGMVVSRRPGGDRAPVREGVRGTARLGKAERRGSGFRCLGGRNKGRGRRRGTRRRCGIQ